MVAPRRVIIHIDLDAFYASVEQRDFPEFAGKPLIVGGHPVRGVVTAASYEVRKFGVHSAMPMAQALRLAPGAIVRPPRFAAYVEASEAVRKIFESATPEIEPLSLDEAFLDVTASLSLLGPPGPLAAHLRARIAKEVGLPASAGIAEVKFAAKLASDLAKPAGQLEVPPGTVREFLRPLPVERLWGVGPKVHARLAREGLRTIGELAARGGPWLTSNFGALGAHLYSLAIGEDPRPVEVDRPAKSVGAQVTFDADLEDRDALAVALHGQALRVAHRLRQAGLKGRTLQISLRFSNFDNISRQTTLAHPSDDGQELYRAAMQLFDSCERPLPVRRTGVAVSGLSGSGGQGELMFEAPSPKAHLNATLDGITEKFGAWAISTADVRATELTRQELDVPRELRRPKVAQGRQEDELPKTPGDDSGYDQRADSPQDD